MRLRSRRKVVVEPQGPLGPAPGQGWGGLLEECLAQCLEALLLDKGMAFIHTWAAVLSVNRHWRAVALQASVWGVPAGGMGFLVGCRLDGHPTAP